jgi:hypothetical protein
MIPVLISSWSKTYCYFRTRLVGWMLLLLIDGLVSTNLKLTHLLFVDDVLIFCNDLMGDADKLNSILDLFGRVTRMKINEQKSTLSVHNMEEVKLIMLSGPLSL